MIRTAALLLSLAGFVCGAPVTEEHVDHAGTAFRIIRASPDAVQIVWKDVKGGIASTDRGQVVNFWDSAGLFLKLGWKNALFLDGDIPQMSVNPEKAVKSNQFGAMFVITD